MQETWKKVVGYEGYEVSNLGQVRSYRKRGYKKELVQTSKLLKQGVNKNGYHEVGLYKEGKQVGVRVHRLVAEAFIPNPNNFPEVDHKDTVKSNNRVDNLRWVTRKENSNNPNTLVNLGKIRKGANLSNETKEKISNSRLNKGCKKVLCVETGVVYPSVKAVADEYGVDIYKALSGKKKAHKKLHFTYV